MANWNPNSNKHKAAHKGYKSRPTKKEISNLLSIYACKLSEVITPTRKEAGVQLKLF